MAQLYESSNPLVRYVHQNRLASIANELPAQDGLRVLDAGCGEGQLLEVFDKKNNRNEYHGVDVTPWALMKAKRRSPRSQFQEANLVNTDYDTESFDLITCTEVIEHVKGCEHVLSELKRILKPDGYLIVTFPNEFLWTISRFVLRRNPVKVPDHVNAFNPKRMESLVGMVPVKQVQLPFNLPFVISLGCLIKFQNR